MHPPSTGRTPTQLLLADPPCRRPDHLPHLPRPPGARAKGATQRRADPTPRGPGHAEGAGTTRWERRQRPEARSPGPLGPRHSEPGGHTQRNAGHARPPHVDAPAESRCSRWDDRSVRRRRPTHSVHTTVAGTSPNTVRASPFGAHETVPPGRRLQQAAVAVDSLSPLPQSTWVSSPAGRRTTSAAHAGTWPEHPCPMGTAAATYSLGIAGRIFRPRMAPCCSTAIPGVSAPIAGRQLGWPTSLDSRTPNRRVRRTDGVRVTGAGAFDRGDPTVERTHAVAVNLPRAMTTE